MGLMVSSIIGHVACYCGFTVCSMFIKFPPYDYSTLTKVMYDVLLIAFFIFSFIILDVKYPRKSRAPIQNRFLVLRHLVILIGLIGSLIIMPGSVNRFWTMYGVIVGFIYYFFHFVQNLDFAYAFAEWCMEELDKIEGKKWYFIWALSSVGYYTMVVTGINIMYHSYIQK